MPYYFPLAHNFSVDEQQRAVARLLDLRRQIQAEIAPRSVENTLVLATWNLRNFDSNRFKHGPRLKEAFFYIAEIISAFDLVALQEVDENLTALKLVIKLLGENWDYIVTDVTEGRSGNKERMAFVFDRRKVSFQHIAGELVLPESQLISDGRQFARTPFMVAFQSGWFRFMICTVHIYYGRDSGEGLKRRVAEIDRAAQFLSRRANDESANYVILGDFNIVRPEHQTMEALRRHGFLVPEELSRLPSNVRRDKHYDQIAFKTRPGQLQFGGRAGVFDFYQSVFREGDHADYYGLMKNRDQLERDADGVALDSPANQDYFLDTWRTFQMSDHLPMWVELKVDFAEQYLRDLVDVSFAAGPEHPLDFQMPELEND